MSEFDDQKVTPIQPFLNTPEPPERKNPAKKIILLAVLLLALILAVCLLMFRDQLNLRRVRQLFSGQSTSEVIYQYDDGSKNAYVSCHNALAALTGSGLTIFDTAGSELGTIQHVYQTPSLRTGKDLVLGCDVGGNRLSAINQSGTAVLDLETDGTILDADISGGDAICYLELLKGYRAVVTVYDKKQNQIYRWYSASQYMNQCAVSESGKYLCAVALDSASGGYESTAVLFRTDQEEPIAQVSLGGQLIWDLQFVDDDKICAVGETQLVLLNTAGEVLGTYDYGEGYVTDYAVGGFTALSMNMYKAGNRFSVVTVDTAGNQLGEQYIGEEVLSISTAGDYCAVLTASHLYVYDKNLNLIATGEDLSAVSSVVMQDDGSVILLGGGTGRLYIPN
ncbi:MAG: DUF5711 family protein [Oscillospiraceae bacterium]|nr:DUF5711 family protein [Oscillospiraceae bacterium]